LARIVYFSPDPGEPSGGIENIYKHVEILKNAKFDAVLLQSNLDSKPSWFSTEVIPQSADTSILDEDILVVPEGLGVWIRALHSIRRKVIFNQGAYFSFSNGFDHRYHPSYIPYLDPSVVATLVVSEDSKRYLEMLEPSHSIVCIPPSVNFNIFKPQTKKRSICYMSRRNERQVTQVVTLLRLRGACRDWQINCLEGLTRLEVAEELSQAALFLSFATEEGFSLPLLEAIACGAYIIGYRPMEYNELLREPFGNAIHFPNVREYVLCVEKFCKNWESNAWRVRWNHTSDLNRRFVRTTYSEIRSEQALVKFWGSIL